MILVPESINWAEPTKKNENEHIQKYFLIVKEEINTTSELGKQNKLSRETTKRESCFKRSTEDEKKDIIIILLTTQF